MGYYHLTEAYSDLYNPRKLEENKMFYDNLRFVDYLTQEHIQEVAESIIWEFVDYGSTFDESYETMMESLSDDGVEEFLTEAAVSYGHDTSNPEDASRIARRQERVSRIKGGVKSAISTTKGAAKTAGSAVGGVVSGAVGKAKAALKGLLRFGAKSALRAGRNIERSGQRAERTTAVYGPGYGRGGSSEPISTSTSGGAKRRAIGGVLKGVGSFIRKATSNKPQVTSAAQPPAIPPITADSLRFHDQNMPKPKALPPAGGSSAPRPQVVSAGQRRAQQRQMLSQKREQEQATRSATIRRGRAQLAQARAATGASVPTNPQGRGANIPPSSATSAYANRLEGPQTRRSASEVQNNLNKARKAGLKRLASSLRENEDLIINIINDLINEGYVNDFDSAILVLENLSENMYENLIEQYTNDLQH